MWCFYIQIAEKITKYPDFSRYVLKIIPFPFKPHPNPIAIFLTLPPSDRQPPSTFFIFSTLPPLPSNRQQPSTIYFFLTLPPSLPSTHRQQFLISKPTHPPPLK